MAQKRSLMFNFGEEILSIVLLAITGIIALLFSMAFEVVIWPLASWLIIGSLAVWVCLLIYVRFLRRLLKRKDECIDRLRSQQNHESSDSQSEEPSSVNRQSSDSSDVDVPEGIMKRSLWRRVIGDPPDSIPMAIGVALYSFVAGTVACGLWWVMNKYFVSFMESLFQSRVALISEVVIGVFFGLWVLLAWWCTIVSLLWIPLLIRRRDVDSRNPPLEQKQKEVSDRLFAQLSKDQQAEILSKVSLHYPKDRNWGLYLLLVEQDLARKRPRGQQIQDLAEAR